MREEVWKAGNVVVEILRKRRGSAPGAGHESPDRGAPSHLPASVPPSDGSGLCATVSRNVIPQIEAICKQPKQVARVQPVRLLATNRAGSTPSKSNAFCWTLVGRACSGNACSGASGKPSCKPKPGPWSAKMTRQEGSSSGNGCGESGADSQRLYRRSPVARKRPGPSAVEWPQSQPQTVVKPPKQPLAAVSGKLPRRNTPGPAGTHGWHPGETVVVTPGIFPCRKAMWPRGATEASSEGIRTLMCRSPSSRSLASDTSPSSLPWEILKKALVGMGLLCSRHANSWSPNFALKFLCGPCSGGWLRSLGFRPSAI